MQTKLIADFLPDNNARNIEEILKSCVHCGFCNATCPTYLELGDERDGPRGRIYLIKALFETGEATRETQYHLDRCLTCLSCETTCPSGVDYSQLIDVGRSKLEEIVKRPLRQRLLMWTISKFIPNILFFGAALKIAQICRPLLPAKLKQKIPPFQKFGVIPDIQNKRRMLLLSACAQSSAKPNTNAAAMRVFNVLGISLKTIKKAGCCGALSHHLSFHEDALAKARRNIDAWWPEIEAGAEAIVITASGCGTMVKDYSSLLKNDKEYTVKADKISQMCRDISEVIIQEDLSDLVFKEDRLRTAVHCPCSLQHGQNLPNIVEDILEKIGVHTIDTMDKHICCGSAGSYSILQPDLSNKLLKNKLQSLVVSNPDQIVTANIGCQMHLESSSKIPVLHWIEIFDDNLVYKNRL